MEAESGVNHSPDQERAFADWKEEARAVPLIEAWAKFGAVLKRAGREHVGPCPACGGTDRFSINPSKSVWNCRGSEGGHDAIGLAMHVGGLSFLQACEELTGRPNPTGTQAKPLSAEEQAERAKRRTESEARQRALKARQAAYEEDTLEAATAIWNACLPIAGTPAENYLACRGFTDLPASLALGFHPALLYPGRSRMPALVCRVDDAWGAITGIWRIYLRADGRGKAEVENAKLGLGPCGGGAVRIGGEGPKIGLAEGLESALGAWCLTGRRYPVWAALSTSGLTGIELPLAVKQVIIYPDGDEPMRRQNGEYVPVTAAPGIKAAKACAERLKAEKVNVTIAAVPPVGIDYCDLYNASRAEVA